MNVPVYTSSYVGSDMMNGPYHGEGMSLTSTHYSHHIEPGAAQQSQAQWQQYQVTFASVETHAAKTCELESS